MTRVSGRLRSEVRERAGQRCEYCHLPEAMSSYRFEAEHIIAEQHKGLTVLDNLAWSCLQCNRPKGPNLTTFDPETGELTRLFNPREQAWEDHFEIVDGEISGKTPVGRATAQLLKFNDNQRVDIRRELIASGRWE
jgi:hypothetical protein